MIINSMAQLASTKPINLTAHSSGTGPLRKERPVYQDLLPPCNRASPAGENIQSWLACAQSGNYFEEFLAEKPAIN
ncbi:MAG: hypothetical protein ABL895_11300 [Cyclobacteriaceae bacterium]